jgi:hypothetical protein
MRKREASALWPPAFGPPEAGVVFLGRYLQRSAFG